MNPMSFLPYHDGSSFFDFLTQVTGDECKAIHASRDQIVDNMIEHCLSRHLKEDLRLGVGMGAHATSETGNGDDGFHG